MSAPSWPPVGRVPSATYDAVRYVLYNEGLNADPDWLFDRLVRLSEEQLVELLDWIDARNETYKRDRSGHPIGSPVRDLVRRFQR